MQRLGPILQFLGCEGNAWGVSLLIVTDDGDPQPTLDLGSSGTSVTVLQTPVPGLSCTAWRFDFAVPQGASSADFDYAIDGRVSSLNVPAEGTMPRIGYASCSGFSDARAMKRVVEPNGLWARLKRLHNLQDRVDQTTFGPLQLLLMGGDQIYSDAMWDVVPELKAWSQLDWHNRVTAPFDAVMETAVQRYFSTIYLERFAEPNLAAALSSIPAVMMWDDHDIFDGWGSYLPELHDSPVFQGVFQVARSAFALFQRHMMGAQTPGTLPGQTGFSSGLRFGPAGLLVLDLRSERRPRSGDLTASGGVLNAEQVMSEQSWRAVYGWLDGQVKAGGMKHLFVMSSIPVVHPSFEVLEKLLGLFPGQQGLEDDLRDQWTSPAHRAERLRLVHHLLDASEQGVRVTLLSGDVHVGALGVIEANRSGRPDGQREIVQLTSSGIVHPAPPGVALFFLEKAFNAVEQMDRGITAKMLEFPATRHRMIGNRNFLTLQPDTGPQSTARYWANWWVEGEPLPYTTVIHPLP